VGAGPGAADLLTLRAVERLRAADVIVHDALVPTRLLDEINPSAARIAVARDLESRPSPGVATGQLLAALVLEGRAVVRLKGGDSAVFARLGEELEPLRQAGIVAEFVPGITAALAAAAAAGVSLTNRDTASSLTIVTGREADEKPDGLDFRRLAEVPGTLAVYMGVDQVARWSQHLMAVGKPANTPVTVVSRCSWPDQRIGTSTLAECVADFERQGWRSPAVVLLGVAAATRSGPLSGRLVLVTRPMGQEGDVVAAVQAAGGECLHVPVISIVNPATWRPLDEAIARADTYDWIVFASGNGVRGFLQRLAAAGRDGRALGTARLAAIGPATRRHLEAAGYRCDLTPDSYRSEGLATALAGRAAHGRFLVVRADKGRDVVRMELERLGHHVDEVMAYESRPVAELEAETLAALDDRLDHADEFLDRRRRRPTVRRPVAGLENRHDQPGDVGDACDTGPAAHRGGYGRHPRRAPRFDPPLGARGGRASPVGRLTRHGQSPPVIPRLTGTTARLSAGGRGVDRMQARR
jgi:uroporphyrinogen III methyltransferase/synthase